MKSNNWTREEHILAFNLYCKIPFTKINANYQPIKKLAAILGRSNNSVAMKLANFARLDPALQARNVKGLTQGAKGEEIVWNEFNNNWEELAYESEKILANYKQIPLEQNPEYIIDDYTGKEKQTLTKQRVNQKFFRDTIMASYNNTCCVTGNTMSEFLIACHIKPWSIDKPNGVNPHNGLCMNILYHTAFDLGYFTITPTYKIILSPVLNQKCDTFIENLFSNYEGKEIILPQRFMPDKKFLEFHNDVIFKK